MQLWQEIAALRADVSKVLQNQAAIMSSLEQIQAELAPAIPARISILLAGKEVPMGGYQLKDDSQVVGSLALVDDKGNPAVLDPASVVSWASSDPTVVTVTPDATGLAPVCAATGKLGSVEIQFSIPAVNAQPAYSGSAEIDVIASAGVSATLTFGAQTQIPAPAAS